jgi:MFS transporter, PPP family, 3-phenylpropionic acid transporter
MLGIWLSAMQVTPRFPEKVSGFTPEKPRTGALQILQQPGFLLLLGAVALTWASHGPLYVYLSLYLKGLGWSGQMISLAWNVGVFAEILVFSFFYRLEGRFALMTIFRVSIFLALVRWLILANFTNPLCILASQALHAFSFGAFYLASIKLAFRTLPDDMRDRGQGFLTGLGSGLGSFLGRMAAGLPGEALTTPELLRLVFWGAAAASIIALTFSAFVPSPQEDGIGKT